ncbi:apolipoprotein N-acyltransferase [Kineococcus siccus]|uniref:apolipoprotein N-acyltransferase n=1 Tax=Kineococcus siccus TaxID=2696567 RepID=UPI0030B8001F
MRPAPPAPLPLLASLPLAVAGGLAAWAAFPGSASDAGWWFNAPVAVALLSIATYGARARRGALLGLAFGWAFSIPHVAWSGTYVGVLPWMALATACAAFYTVLGLALPRLQRARWGLGPLAVACGWIAVEALAERQPFEGFPWGKLAFSQADAPTLGLAALGGAPLVSFGVTLAGALLGAAVLALARVPAPPGAPRPARRARPAVVAVALAAVVTGAGALVPRPTAAEDGTARVAAVQGNTPEEGLDFNAERRAVLDNHASATLGLARRIEDGTSPQPDLVLWPENSSDIDPFRNPDARAVIDRAVDAVGAPTLVGAVLQGPGESLSNAGLVVNPGTGIDPDQRYVKQHPAPFAEYMPYRSFFRTFTDKVDLVPRDFVHGDRVGLLDMGGVRVGDVICFEVNFDGIVRDTVRAGAQVLVVQTNNATFGMSNEAVQQLAMSRLRAVESGRSVVHVSTVGVSAIITPDGAAHQETSLFTQAVLEADVPLRSTQTVATRVGAAPEVVLTALGVLLLLLARPGARGGRRGRDPRREDAGTPTSPKSPVSL